MKKINVGLIGFGTVGRGVYRLLRGRNSFFKSKLGIDIRLRKVYEINRRTLRKFSVPKQLIASSARDLVGDPEIDIVIELIGGIHPAKEYIKKALSSGKFVVTANKALLSECGEDLFKLAKRFNCDIYFEASVMAGVPIIKVIREGFVANKINAIYGIINGTSNYILSKMTDEAIDFNQALKLAKKKGYAERNPALDIGGLDCAHKLALITYLSFGKAVRLENIYVEGIKGISPIDIQYAKELGYVVKLLGISKLEQGRLQIRVHPTLLPKRHPLASVSGVFNAVFISADLVGDVLLYGRGAGQLPAASAVVSDVVDVALNIKSNTGQRLPVSRFVLKARLAKMQELMSRYYLRFMAIDKPGVLAKISGILGKHHISIASVSQKERRRAKVVPVVILTHEAKEKDVQEALKEMHRFVVIKRFPVAFRIEGK
ncbi:MAG: homoserine dehydrogenase [Candidatus Omnitrophica bacterium]|nr:homoserine dehydrogenase [Candidatus Omnitrophota bacterium]